MLGLTIKHLQASKAIARQGTLTAAAGAVGVMPWAMTMGLKAPAIASEFPLFDRAPQGLWANRDWSMICKSEVLGRHP